MEWERGTGAEPRPLVSGSTEIFDFESRKAKDAKKKLEWLRPYYHYTRRARSEPALAPATTAYVP